MVTILLDWAQKEVFLIAEVLHPLLIMAITVDFAAVGFMFKNEKTFLRNH